MIPVPKLNSRWKSFFAFLPLLFANSVASAQSVGGNSEIIFQWRGENYFDYFGNSVSNAGDLNADGIPDLVVGAYVADANGIRSPGTASAYSGATGEMLFRWTGKAMFDHFGYSVSNAGDVNGDGFDDVIIGAPKANNGARRPSGRAYVYSGSDGSLIYQFDGSHANAQFASTVSGAGDVNADGFDDVIIGAPHSMAGVVLQAGAAFVYSGASGELLYSWYGMARQKFGSSVSNAGDINQDGYDDLLIGIPKSNNPWTLSGKAVVYSGKNGKLLREWRGQYGNGNLGRLVSNAGDLNADGIEDVLLGALSFGGSFGYVYAYSGSDGSFLYKWIGTEQYDHFGSSISNAGDFNADGFDDVIIGAKWADSNGLHGAGSAFIYSGANGTQLAQLDGRTEKDNLGCSVSNAGDLNFDGNDDVIVGAYRYTHGTDRYVGGAAVFGFHSLIQADKTSISATDGGTLTLALDFPDATGDCYYRILASATGTGPSHYGVDIPLTWDTMMMNSILGVYPIHAYNDFHGQLDINGNASARMTLPGGMSSDLIGNTYYFAAIANKGGRLPSLSSVAVSLTITP